VFLAPETGGDFNTLVNAVQRPSGRIRRTSQDLNQPHSIARDCKGIWTRFVTLACRSRRLKEAAPLVARSLAIKVERECLDKIPLRRPPACCKAGNR